MPLFEPGSPDISEGLPSPFSTRNTFVQINQPGLADFSRQADILVEGLPFRLAITNNDPYQRQSAPLSKDQLDTSKEAGEQTLSGWWTRSQNSWHKGAGIKFYEPGSDDGTEHRFIRSAGIDVWTEGELRLLRTCPAVTGASGSGQYVTTALTNAGPRVAVIGPTSFFLLDSAGIKSGIVDVSGLQSTRACVRGNSAFFGHSGGVGKIALGGTAYTNIATQEAGTSPVVYYAKSRLIVTKSNAIYEMAPSPSAPVALGSATPLFTHPLGVDWTWTGVAEGPQGFFISGRTAGYGAIYHVGIDTQSNAALPTLAAPVEVATFPPGEQVHSIASYLGAYLAIGTNRGVRVALIGDGGRIQYGPLVVETPSPVNDLAARDSFIYAAASNAIDGKAGAIRINLAQEIGSNSLRFAYATDIQTKVSGTVSSLAFVGVSNQLAAAMTDTGIHLSSTSAYEPSGYLQSGFVRFATTELKQFQLARLGASIGAGAVTLSSVNRDGDESSLLTYGGINSPDTDIRITSPRGPQEILGFKLTFAPNQTATQSPVVRGLQVKALPAPAKRQRLIQIPLYCHDSETDRFGNTIRGVGYARLSALESLESSTALVQIVDRRTQESFSATIEQITFRGTQPPSRAEQHFDGIVLLTVRAV